MDSGDSSSGIKALDGGSIHKITSGQVVVDLQTAVKELVENSLDAGATNIEVRFKDYGLEFFEVIDNGSGISPADYDSIALKHHTSKLSSFTDLEAVTTFGFRGEALSSLCALAESVSVTTATSAEAPVGTVIEFERTGKVKSRKGKAARQRGTTVTVSGLFKPLPVRRKELERNAKREFGKSLTLLHAYALVPCAKENKGVRLSVTNHPKGGKKSSQLRTDGTPSTRASVSAIWSPKALDNLVDLELDFNVEVEAAVLRRLGKTQDDGSANEVKVRGLISKFAVGSGRTGTDRQFFFVNGRPCSPSKVQKAFNEVYRSFNATQSPFIIADFVLPTNSCDINVSPDKRTILLHSENHLVQALRAALEEKYAPARSTFDVNATQAPRKADSITKPVEPHREEAEVENEPLFLPDDAGDEPPAHSSQSSNSVGSAAPVMPARRSVSPAQEDEFSFGVPTLLSGPSASSSAEDASANDESGDSQRGTVDRAAQDAEDEDEAPGSDHARANGLSKRARSAGDNQTRTKDVPQSPTITQMVAKRSARASLSSAGDADEDGAVEDILTADVSNEPHSSPLPRRVASARQVSVVDDPPIPAVCPPARPTTRMSSLPQPSSSQMVLSTSGASWNLRRPADEPGSAERPRKKGRRESPESSKDTRQGMRQLLRGFARTGSQVDETAMDVDEDEKDEEEGGVEHDEAEVNMEDVGVTEDVRSVASDGDSGDPPEDDPQETEPSESHDVFMEDHTVEDIEEIEVDSVEVVQGVIEIPEDDIPTAPSQGHAREHSDVGTSSAITTAVSEEIIRTNEREGVSLTFDLSRVTSAWKKLHTRLADAQREQEVIVREKDRTDRPAVPIDVADEEATEVLSRVIDKADFATMEVLGQFNRGFIIVRRRKTIRANSEEEGPGVEMDDLFIVDQHAADEKYNFETLQQTTKIDSQKLFHPQVLELTAADELVALENVDVLRQNGFELAVCEDRPPGQRVQLEARPISKSTVFDTKDLEELLHLLQDCPAGQMVRCSKARAMFAMRACRMSIMIGTPLSRRQMTSVVQHMGTMDQPWHCPHGRPTMRHLSDVAGAGWERRRGRARDLDWAAFGRAEA
ncbi:DNA mismatch repair protein MutL [Trametes versicolor FP-101664 SS1]|uniref:DNA mismatch repair protein MutL n=1 Tax=Trametes versicolor (strain FP-101664) TaxID=717944 RepID=UPI00046212E8|nr:DNA mismatch repair protein MutL [Trametes versicolor FP-101664 SS1]EIW57082.1 DNA mismatch repair protein MutL [Trametes versicolor FP-101664 SS1]